MDLEELLDEIYERGASELYAQMDSEEGKIEDLENWKKTKADYIAVMVREIRKIEK